jgi:hypothetical protein
MVVVVVMMMMMMMMSHPLTVQSRRCTLLLH